MLTAILNTNSKPTGSENLKNHASSAPVADEGKFGFIFPETSLLSESDFANSDLANSDLAESDKPASDEGYSTPVAKGLEEDFAKAINNKLFSHENNAPVLKKNYLTPQSGSPNSKYILRHNYLTPEIGSPKSPILPNTDPKNSRARSSSASISYRNPSFTEPLFYSDMGLLLKDFEKLMMQKCPDVSFFKKTHASLLGDKARKLLTSSYFLLTPYLNKNIPLVNDAAHHILYTALLEYIFFRKSTVKGKRFDHVMKLEQYVVSVINALKTSNTFKSLMLLKNIDVKSQIVSMLDEKNPENHEKISKIKDEIEKSIKRADKEFNNTEKQELFLLLTAHLYLILFKLEDANKVSTDSLKKLTTSAEFRKTLEGQNTSYNNIMKNLIEFFNELEYFPNFMDRISQTLENAYGPVKNITNLDARRSFSNGTELIRSNSESETIPPLELKKPYPLKK